MKKSKLFLLILFMAFSAHSQSIVLEFNAHHSCEQVNLDSIWIQNLTQGGKMVLYYPNNIAVFAVTDIGESDPQHNHLYVTQNYPNPFSALTYIDVYLAAPDLVVLNVYDLTGRTVTRHEGKLEEGMHRFSFSAGVEKTYILTVTSGKHVEKQIMLQMGVTGSAVSEINYLGAGTEEAPKTAPKSSDFNFNPGDDLRFTGFVTDTGGDVDYGVINDTPEASTEYLFDIANNPPDQPSEISGNNNVPIYATDLIYAVEAVEGLVYLWSVPDGWEIIYGQGSHAITVNAGNEGGEILVKAVNNCGLSEASVLSVDVYDDPEPGTVTDIDGNVYQTVIIGEQEWMAENLRVTHYQNGDPIPDGSGLGNAWPDADYFFYYDDNPDYAETYGLLYNGFVIQHDQEICPLGWKVPDHYQWMVMEMELGMSWKQANNTGVLNGTDEGGKLKATGLEHWHMPNVGATDAFGFNMLPAGSRGTNFSGLGQSSSFFTPISSGGAIKYREYSFNHPRTFNSRSLTAVARSLRCIKIQADQSPPEVSTGNVSSVMASSAQVEGTVIDTGNATVVARGIAYGTYPNPEVDTQQNFSFTHDGQGIGSFSGELIDLLPGWTYYARAYAVNANGIAYGDQVSFTTEQASLPTLRIISIPEIGQTSASLLAEVSNEGESNVTNRGLVWSMAESPTLNDNSIEAGSGTGQFTLEITDLEPNTLYYVRAYATNNQGTSYSSRRVFITLTDSPPPQIAAPAISDLTATSANLSSTLLDDGGEEIMEMGFIVNGEEFSLGASPEVFSLSLENLIPITEHMVQAYAINQNGRVTSSSVSFITLFNTTDEAMTLLQRIYNYMYQLSPYGNHDAFGVKSFDLTNDLMGEDMVVHSPGYGWFNAHYRYQAHVHKYGSLVSRTWALYYLMIDQVNTILAHIDAAEGPDVDKDNIRGQLLAMRAFCHFELVQVFSHPYSLDPESPGIPYVMAGSWTTLNLDSQQKRSGQSSPTAMEQDQDCSRDNKQYDRGHYPWLGTGVLNRGTVSEVYEHLQTDLDQAISLLTGAEEQQHPSHIDLAVAHGIRARVALVSEDFASASLHAQAAIDAFGSDKLFSPSDYPEALELIYSEGGQTVGYDFTAMSGFNNAGESSEWMWGSVIPEEHATNYASFWSHMDPRFMTYASLGGQKKITASLFEQFPVTDVRRNLFMPEGLSFVGNYNGYGAYIPPLTQLKFLVQQLGSWAGDYVYMRLAEMYLIRAEAEARNGQNIAAASTLYDLVSQRDPAYTLSTNTGDVLLQEILLHRRIELWGEGHRFKDIRRLQLDLNRCGSHDPAMASLMYLPPNSDLFLWVIPFHSFLDIEIEGEGMVYAEGEHFVHPLYVAWQSGIHLEAAAEPGWYFSQWFINGEPLGDSSDYSLLFEMPSDDVTLTANFQQEDDDSEPGTVIDIDGNVYQTVIIGNQEWMAENLRVTRYNNEDDIPTGLSNPEWSNTTEGAYAIYNNDDDMLEAYGKLYNWYAVNDARGLCPEGWSVPSDADWTALINYVVSEGFPNSNATNGAGNALKSCRQVDSPLGGDCDTSEHPRWNSDGTHSGFDEFGFSALPGGSRNPDGYFNIGYTGYWWSSSEYSSSSAWFRLMGSFYGDVGRISSLKRFGLSVRCVRDITEEPNLYNLNLEVNPEGAGSVSGAGEYEEGSEASVTATANPDWEFVRWTGDTQYLNDEDSAEATVTMPADDVNLIANFETVPDAPIATTLAASDITATSAVLNASVYPNHLETIVIFEWGLTDEFGNEVVAEQTPIEGGINVSVSAMVADLEPSTTYHFRVVAENELGYSYGEVRQFNTSGTVIDIDGNEYQTVIIGNQEWMAENLRVTRDASGNNITRYCHGNNTANCELYGGLYTWHTVMNGQSSSSSNPSGVQGICPIGWHVPSNAQWTEFVNYVVGQGYPNNSNHPKGAGNALKSCRQVDSPLGGDCDTSEHPRWNSHSPHYGFDEFGFLALPGGSRSTSGSFSTLGASGYWWSSTEYAYSNAYFRLMYHGFGGVTQNIYPKTYGFSLRCVRDNCAH